MDKTMGGIPMILQTCCFTGHRPRSLPWGMKEADGRCMGVKALLAQELERAYQEGFRYFWSGMAMGGDLMFAEAVLACQMVHPEVELYAAIPYPEQARSWPERERERYARILAAIGTQHSILIAPRWNRMCLRQRNEYMVDRSCRVIALYDGRTAGGTQYTLHYAMHKGLEQIVIDPYTLRVLR